MEIVYGNIVALVVFSLPDADPETKKGKGTMESLSKALSEKLTTVLRSRCAAM